MPKYIFIAFFLIVMLPAYAMSDDSQWAEAIKGASFVSVERTSGDDYIAVGSKNNKALLVRLDSSGKVQWAKTYQFSNHDKASAVLRTGDGGFVFTGYTGSIDVDAFVVKVDADGNILWQKAYGTRSYDEGRLILRASDGGFFLLGRSGSDIWCMKLSSKKEISWIRIYGRRDQQESVADAVRTSDGGLIFAGRQGDTLLAKTILVKIDSSGNITWQKKLGGHGEPSSIATTADGGYVIGGYTDALGISAGWVAKLDSTGNISWSKMIPPRLSGKRVTALRQENDGHILVVGSTVVGGKRQIWNARFNLQGELLSEQAFGEYIASNGISAIHDTPYDGIVFVGFRETDMRTYGLIGRTSWEGNVCTAFEKSTFVQIKDSDMKVESAHVGIREGAFDVRTPDFVRTLVDTKMIDLCK